MYCIDSVEHVIVLFLFCLQDGCLRAMVVLYGALLNT